jgi:hypothetical protein
MKWQRIRPTGLTPLVPEALTNCVESHFASFVAPDEIAPGEDRGNGRPFMGMERDGFSRFNQGFYDPNLIIFLDQAVVMGGSNEGVKW